MLVEKEVISPGIYWYKDESTGLPRKLDVTPDMCRYWGEQGNKMIETGLTVPVPYEHDFQAHPMTPKEKLLNNAGEVKAYKLRDILEGDPLFDPKRGPVKDVLFGAVEVQDPDVKSKIGNSIRWTSPWISSFTDGNGREWKNVISHLALTTRPRITKQQPFPSIAAALSLARPVGYSQELFTTKAVLDIHGTNKDGFCLTRACKLDDSGEPLYSKYFSMCAGVPLVDGAAFANAKLVMDKPARETTTSSKGDTDRNLAGIATETDAHPSTFTAHSASKGTSSDQGSRARRARQSSKAAYDASIRGDSPTAASHHYEAGMRHARVAQWHHTEGRHNEAEMHAKAAELHFAAAKHHVTSARSGKGGYAKAFASEDSGMEHDKDYHPDYKKLRDKAGEASATAWGHTQGNSEVEGHHQKGKNLHLDAMDAHENAEEEAPNDDARLLHRKMKEIHKGLYDYHKRGHEGQKDPRLSVGLATDAPPKKKPPEKKADKKSDNPLAALEDESEDEASAAQTGSPEVEAIVDPAAAGGTAPPCATSPALDPNTASGDGNFPPPEELICDLLQALGVPMPDVSNDTQFKRHLYEAVMSKIKELTSKGMGQQAAMPDQNLPTTQQPNASQPSQNPNVQQEQQPMMMSLQDINKLEEPLRSVALSMHQETQKAQTKAAEADKLLHSLRDVKLKEENDKRVKRVALLGRFMPKAKADLEAMLVAPQMALSMGEGGNIIDPMAQTLAILEKGLQELPRAWTTDTAALSVQPQPKDEEMLTEERANDIADGFARMCGAAPLAK